LDGIRQIALPLQRRCLGLLRVLSFESDRGDQSFICCHSALWRNKSWDRPTSWILLTLELLPRYVDSGKPTISELQEQAEKLPTSTCP